MHTQDFVVKHYLFLLMLISVRALPDGNTQLYDPKADVEKDVTSVLYKFLNLAPDHHSVSQKTKEGSGLWYNLIRNRKQKECNVPN